MLNFLVCCVIVETFLLLLLGFRLLYKKYDGRLIIHEARDSYGYEIHINTDPEEIKYKESIELSVEHIGSL